MVAFSFHKNYIFPIAPLIIIIIITNFILSIILINFFYLFHFFDIIASSTLMFLIFHVMISFIIIFYRCFLIFIRVLILFIAHFSSECLGCFFIVMIRSLICSFIMRGFGSIFIFFAWIGQNNLPSILSSSI